MKCRNCGNGDFEEHGCIIVDEKGGGAAGVYKYKPSYSNEAGRKFDDNKPRYELIPPEALEELAWLYTDGAAKYAPHDWEKGWPWCRSFGAMMRHAWEWLRGEDRDPENGRHHMAAVAFYAFAIITFTKRGVGNDDRPSR
jgi:Domain of unknown function (DUF5664)